MALTIVPVAHTTHNPFPTPYPTPMFSSESPLCRSFVDRLIGNARAIKGCNGRTVSGLAWDVAKSGLQKSVRRGHVDQAVYFGLDLFACAVLASRNVVSDEYYAAHGAYKAHGPTTMKALVTNLLNRLRICACEDIGVANVDVFPEMEGYLARVEAWRSSGGGLAGFQSAASCVASVCAVLAASPKSRAISEFRAVLHLPPYAGTGTVDKTWKPYMASNNAAIVGLLGLDVDAVSARIPLFARLKALRDWLVGTGFNPGACDESGTCDRLKAFLDTRCTDPHPVKTIMMAWYKTKKEIMYLFEAIGCSLK